MRRLVVTGLSIEFQKVEFKKTLKGELGCSLSEAKAMTGAVLEGQSVQFDVAEEQFDRMSVRLVVLGAVFHEEGC